MQQAQIEILSIAMVTAAACALPGAFLILRRMAMMSDAISHTILLGIVVGFFITHDLNSPLLVAGAAMTGVITVFLVELVQKTGLASEDSSIGLIFPFLFSIGVLLISRYAGNVHLDTDSVLLGELAFAPFDRLVVSGVDIGPKSLYVMGGILLINLLYIAVFYKELKIVTFDPALAAVLCFSPALIHYSLMTLVSVTAVGAFNAVGTILLVALMICPPAAAFFISEKLSHMLLLSVLFGLLSAVAGYWAAFWLDVSIAGSMAVMTGVVFLAVFLLAPEKGMIALIRRGHEQKYEFAGLTLLFHLLNHEGRPDAEYESRPDTIASHFAWTPAFLQAVTRRLTASRYIELEEGGVRITDSGRNYAAGSEMYQKTLQQA
ncbi:MAG: metal ABC transporter permease [Sporomusaceae bacterium]|nr:metal ABC transporter permease [Sporomusaceae bacterium]